MHKRNSIVMRAPKMSIFETAANLELWPTILPHYRYIRFLERSPDRNIVVMAARRSGIPISWTSEQIIDRSKSFPSPKKLDKRDVRRLDIFQYSRWCAGRDLARFTLSHPSARTDY
ncbi:MAG: hypothetical protein DME50_16220 [Verrucomicrobia bacterium]|nr:MAG: hypothetical protein DME50_16220 [Verrucomicrobiota bacterium]